MTSITRTDIEQDFMTPKLITTESPKKKYAHPADSVVSQIHCFIADGHFGHSGSFKGTYSKRKSSSSGNTGAMPSSGEVNTFKGTRRR